MSRLDDQLLLVQSSTDAKNEDTDDKMNKFEAKLDKLIALVKHMMHHNQISSPYNNVEEYIILDITK